MVRNATIWLAIIGIGIVGSDSLEAAPVTKKKPLLTSKHVVSNVVWPFNGAWTPGNLCKAYNFPKNLAGGGVIGIVELGGTWNQSDLDAFSKMNNMPKIAVTNVSVDGGQPIPDPFGADVEVMLDIEMSAFTYFYATGKMPKIYVFFAPNTFQGFIDCVGAASANGCDVLSISWGTDEANWEAGQPGSVKAFEAAAAAASKKGMTLFAASGDTSSSDDNFNFTDPNVDCPASCPHVVACGGTTKFTSSEIVWGDGNPFDLGTGGGYSAIFPVQSWQIGAPAPPKGLGRMVPDISADADPATGVVIVADGLTFAVGGTSMVAPFYSGLFAAFGTKLSLKGNMGPTLWANQRAFVDITVGFNGDYDALPGPDPCTGIGVPNAALLADVFGYTGNLNFVTLTTDTIANTISLTGDKGSNNVSLAWSKGTITVSTSSNTVLGTPSSHQTSTTIKWPNSNVLLITGAFTAGGDDYVSITGVPVTTATFNFGSGNDTAILMLDNIGTLNFNGGAGTNTLSLIGTTVGKENIHVVNANVIK